MTKSWKVGGPAGYGIKTVGQLFAYALLSKGYYVFLYPEYPSLIRGGHNTYQVEFSYDPICSIDKNIDFLIAFDQLTIDMDLASLKRGGVVICDSACILPKRGDITVIPLAFKEILDKAHLDFLLKNSLAIGASLALLGLKFSSQELFQVLNKKLGDNESKNKAKITQVLKDNIKAVEEGYQYVASKYGAMAEIKTVSKTPKALISGNEAIAIGAIQSGCKFYAAYPMTPATSILEYLKSKEKEAKIIVHQAEDEIAAVHNALGASAAGVRAMTGTSGGGFALMNEAVSLSGMTETPVVIVEAMRSSPATGLPTWTGQDDLKFIAHSGHGDFPRVILAPGSPSEAFQLIQDAFNLADIYQCPVFCLDDKYLGESQVSADSTDFTLTKKINRGKLLLKKAPKNYKRYELTASGISARTVPGVANGEFIANSDEHNELGYSVEGYTNDRSQQMKKRMLKDETLRKNIPLPKIYGPAKAKVGIVSWGSNWGTLLDVLKDNQFKIANKQLGQVLVNYIHFSYLYPLPVEKIKNLLKQYNYLILVEQNYTGQFGKLLAEETGIQIENKFLKYDGRPFFRQEILDFLTQEKLKPNSFYGI
ncbi:MAG TPA: 2-oxoacid:acceptor oxidoreductase subunit alpha [Candidatus Paceibacterota bacterium]|nr:2-oxoacid:acceptor oxidoreductase subunit alpha [Candidatus Paceibacterota bacterium]